MNNDNARNQGLRRPGLLPVITAVAVLATACGGSNAPSSASGGSARYQEALAYSKCMRGHGVPDFPDPDAAGSIIQSAHPGQQADTNSSVAQAADNACRHLLPGGGNSNSAGFNRAVQQDLKVAQCMRAHGEPDYPDPKVSPGFIDIGLGHTTINQNSPQFKASERACKSLIPPSMFPGGS
jgi:hypothetical protein